MASNDGRSGRALLSATPGGSVIDHHEHSSLSHAASPLLSMMKSRRRRTSRRQQSQAADSKEDIVIKNISKVRLGCYEIDAWYYSPYPGEYGNADTLYLCDTCLKYKGNILRTSITGTHVRAMVTLPGLRFTENLCFQSLRLVVRRKSCIAKICASFRSCFWITRQSITTCLLSRFTFYASVEAIMR